ncbi:hypothetical protein TNCV_316551 [Trichonephila clavipes]|nr:hypothetical protein TNCV_316551 [Trichonephila clavipes]
MHLEKRVIFCRIVKSAIIASANNNKEILFMYLSYARAWLLDRLTLSLPVPNDDVVSRVFIESSALEQVVAIHSGMAAKWHELEKGLKIKATLEDVSQRTTRGLLVTDHVILKNGQVTRTTPEPAPHSPNYHTTPTVERLFLDRFNGHHCLTWRVYRGNWLELMTRQVSIRYLYHLATTAVSNVKSVQTQSPFIGLVWYFGEGVPAQILSWSFERGSKLYVIRLQLSLGFCWERVPMSSD